jgi:hypothetical protein
MSRDLDPRAAVLIVPEGANFTERRRQRGIDRLEEAGHSEEAEWARSMQHVSAPRPGGALAAIEAAPEADVIITGHTGFPTSFREVWRLLPHPQIVEVRFWAIPTEDIPTDRDDGIGWLFARPMAHPRHLGRRTAGSKRRRARCELAVGRRRSRGFRPSVKRRHCLRRQCQRRAR